MNKKDTPTELTEEKTRAFLERASTVRAKMAERRKLSEDIAALQRRGKELDAELIALVDGEDSAPPAAPAPQPRAPSQKKPAPRRKKSKGHVRSDEKIETTAARILKLLGEPQALRTGMRAEKIKKRLKLKKCSYKVPLKWLIQRGEVRQEGVHRGALYFKIVKETETEATPQLLTTEPETNGVAPHMVPAQLVPSTAPNGLQV